MSNDQPPTDKAVTEFMESHGFRRLMTADEPVWAYPKSSIYSINDKTAFFFYTICQKAKLEAQVDEIHGLFVTDEDGKVVGLIDNSMHDIDKRLRNLNDRLAQLTNN